MSNFLDRRKFLPIQKTGGICKPLIFNNQIRFLPRCCNFHNHIISFQLVTSTKGAIISASNMLIFWYTPFSRCPAPQTNVEHPIPLLTSSSSCMSIMCMITLLWSLVGMLVVHRRSLRHRYNGKPTYSPTARFLASQLQLSPGVPGLAPSVSL